MTNEEKKLYLLDAFALIYRSYYAFINNPRITTTGINTSATFGFFNFLLEILELEKPTHLAVVFDPEGPTFRHEMFPQYKAQRPPMPEDLKKSIPYIKKIIEGLGIACVTVDGFEADDVVGTLAKRGEKEGFQVYMITPDKDYAQLVSEKVFMYKPGRSGNKSEVWGIPEVLDHFGIERVEQVIDILGLMGDTADNVPGCAGIGPKSAATLIYKYGSIEGVYRHIEELKGKQKESLLCCQNTVFLSKELVTINTEVPTDVNVADLFLGEIKDDVLKPIFNELELFSLAKRVFAIEHEEKLVDTIHPEEVEYRELTTKEEREELLQTLKEAPEFVLNAIFGDGTIYNSYPDYLCFSTASNSACYFRLPSGKAEAEWVIRSLSPVFEDEGKILISNDVKDDIIWLRRVGIEVKNRIFDIKIAHYVLQPDSSHELERVALELLNYRLIKGDNTENPQLSLFPEEGSKKDKDYAERTDILFRLKSKLEEALKDVGLYKLFEELEMPLVGVLADMEYEGVSIDKGALKELSEELKEKIAESEKIIYEIAGEEFNISSPKQLGEVLFDRMNIDPGNKKTKTGQYSTSEQVLSKLEEAHPIVGHILNYRGLKKLLTTYAEALPTYIDPGTGKIHTHFNQAEAATGRLSSLNPNLQNIPIRTEEGRNIRKAFITGDPDYGFFSADYSQVELRLMAHLSGAPGLIDAFLNGEDIHAETASKIYHVPLNEVTPEMRRRAKTANFGIIYGISAWGLAERLKISRKEGKELIDGYFNLYPGVKRYMEESVEKARKQGYVETIMGRRRYLRDINSRNAVVRGVAERNAVNAPIQGSAADIIKKAMICIHQKIKERGLRSKMILQVHDELNFKCHHEEIEELKQLVIDCMEHVVSLAVPLTVGTGYGKSWYEAH
ncbi:DNA polymerase I [Butyricimonas hominis]|uniref:DNA polymerase I n=1 Tax=Butyricimonas hominis TaxID=2763032 RepID=A0ABR7CWM7_9BACT|nr:DNA polymerase I [Butyricimonas hominis]MBC5620088.1 DNA polymerase I [Butyricimonas hominis]